MPLYSFDFSRAPYPFGPDTRACCGLVGLEAGGRGGGVREIYYMCVRERLSLLRLSRHRGAEATASAPPAPSAPAPEPAAAL